nr:hypothetical protein [Candidatus Woesearchaeota archaeon]
MSKFSTIWIKKETKEELDKIKLCPDETYNSLLIRMLNSGGEIERNNQN